MANTSGGNNAGRSKKNGPKVSAGGKAGVKPGTTGGSSFPGKDPKKPDRLGMGRGKRTPPSNKK